MKSLMQTLQKNRKNNKGFTLVELIIVIAIIAVLAAVLAPQYIKYVERSRKSADINTAGVILNAAKVIAVDPEVNDDTFTVTWASTGASATGSITVTGLTNATNITDITGTPVKPVSDFAETTANLVITVTNGVATVAPAGWATELNTTPAP